MTTHWALIDRGGDVVMIAHSLGEPPMLPIFCVMAVQCHDEVRPGWRYDADANVFRLGAHTSRPLKGIVDRR